MHSPSLTHIIFVALAASSSTVALRDMSVAQGRALFAKRQDGGSQAFKPDSRVGFGDTCEEAFGSGSIECGVYQGRTKCYTPTTGASCCSEGYTCPGESFCLTQGYCCPEGLSPETCAIDNGVTLSAGFKTDAVTPSATPSSAKPTSVAVSVTSKTLSSTVVTSETSSSAETTSAESTSAKATSDVSNTIPIVTSAGISKPKPTSASNGTTSPSVTPPPFTGAGHTLHSVASGAVAAVVGLIGIMGTFF